MRILESRYRVTCVILFYRGPFLGQFAISLEECPRRPGADAFEASKAILPRAGGVM